MNNPSSIDCTRLEMLREAMGLHLRYDRPVREYEWNVISKDAVIYTCGRMGRSEENLAPYDDAEELDSCQRLSNEVAQLMAGRYMVNDDGTHSFSPFYVTMKNGIGTPHSITEDLVRRAFGYTIHLSAAIKVEPLAKTERWWLTIEDCAADDDDADEYLAAWSSMMQWFQEQPELSAPSFVSIGLRTIQDENGGTGCVFPRLMVGLTGKGSLVGVLTYVTQS